MPLSEAEKKAFHDRKTRATHREVTRQTVEPMVRFGRKWLWDLTMHVPLLMLENALDAKWSELGFDVAQMERRLCHAFCELVGVEAPGLCGEHSWFASLGARRGGQ